MVRASELVFQREIQKCRSWAYGAGVVWPARCLWFALDLYLGCPGRTGSWPAIIVMFFVTMNIALEFITAYCASALCDASLLSLTMARHVHAHLDALAGIAAMAPARDGAGARCDAAGIGRCDRGDFSGLDGN